ncbi:MAG: hypothetical protein RBU45_24905 [Myxococcota bacterium]|nr:hypothetical protein [Myxococcota bacterium]
MPRREQLMTPRGEPFVYETLAVAPADVLEEVLRRGTTPALDDLAGWEYRGYNTPDVTRLLGIRKFKKGFYRSPEGPPAQIAGYNVKIRQNGSLLLPWEDLLVRDAPVRFGWYDVYPVRLGEEDNRYPDALLLNYGSSPKNPPLDPSRLLRDYLVQVYPDDPELLLGKAMAALGVFRVCVGYFVLGRSNPGPVSP